MLIVSLFVALRVAFAHIVCTFNAGVFWDLPVSVCAYDGTAAPTDCESSSPIGLLGLCVVGSWKLGAQCLVWPAKPSTGACIHIR